MNPDKRLVPVPFMKPSGATDVTVKLAHDMADNHLALILESQRLEVRPKK